MLRDQSTCHVRRVHCPAPYAFCTVNVDDLYGERTWLMPARTACVGLHSEGPLLGSLKPLAEKGVSQMGSGSTHLHAEGVRNETIDSAAYGGSYQ